MFTGTKTAAADAQRELRTEMTEKRRELMTTTARLCKELGLATSRVHDIGHFVATAMIAQGLNVRRVADGGEVRY
jgi:hypothetical protein